MHPVLCVMMLAKKALGDGKKISVMQMGKVDTVPYFSECKTHVLIHIEYLLPKILF